MLPVAMMSTEAKAGRNAVATPVWSDRKPEAVAHSLQSHRREPSQRREKAEMLNQVNRGRTKGE
jgi:hypothetical protein